MLESFARKNANQYAVATVNIASWKSPVAQEYKIQAIPCFIVFDASGRKIAEGAAATQQVMRLLR